MNQLAATGAASDIRVTILSSGLTIGTDEHREVAATVRSLGVYGEPEILALDSLYDLSSADTISTVFLLGCECLGNDGKILHPGGLHTVLDFANARRHRFIIVAESYKVIELDSIRYPRGMRPDGSDYALDCVNPKKTDDQYVS